MIHGARPRMTSSFHTNTFGVEETPSKQLKKSRDELVEATGEVLRNKGCAAAHVEREEDAGSRPAIYVYSFENADGSKAHLYTVDAKSYNHVILFPIFWITYFTANPRSVYKEALTNFLERSL